MLLKLVVLIRYSEFDFKMPFIIKTIFLNYLNIKVLVCLKKFNLIVCEVMAKWGVIPQKVKKLY